MLQSVLSYDNDVALCQIWFTERNFNTYKLSKYLDLQCLTIMVPRRTTIDIARIIYLPLTIDMWFGVAIAFISIVLILYAISKWGMRLRIYEPRYLPFRHLSTAYIEVINIATSHGVTNFPLQTSIKFVVLSWLLFSFILDATYSSRYVSLMISTPLTKAIDTVEEFLESPLKLGEMTNDFSLVNQQSDLHFCNDSICLQLAKRVVFEKTIEDRIQNIESKQYGYIVTRLSNDYVANVPLRNVFNRVPLRLMRGCFMKYFTALAFSPWSPWSRFFSYKLNR